MKAAVVAAANASAGNLRPSHPVGGAWRLASLVPLLWALVGFAAAPVDSPIQFPGDLDRAAIGARVRLASDRGTLQLPDVRVPGSARSGPMP